MIAKRNDPLSDITCPAASCKVTLADHRKMERHFKAAHILPLAIREVDVIQATPAERQALPMVERTRNHRYQPYPPPPSGPKDMSRSQAEVDARDSDLPDDSMDVELDGAPGVEDPMNEITSQVSRITPFCKCHKCSDSQH
jgi:hypothetical protein